MLIGVGDLTTTGNRQRALVTRNEACEMEHSDQGAARLVEDDPARPTKAVGRALWLAAVLAAVAVIPYTYSILNQQAPERQPATATLADLASNALIESLISYCFIGLGLRLRNSLGLGLALLADWPPVDDQTRRRLRNTIALAMVLGLASGIIPRRG